MIRIRTDILVLSIVCLTVPAWADFGMIDDASSISSANGLQISLTGKFTIAGTETFLLGTSYFDALDYHTSDIDTLSMRGFNNLRIFTDWANDDGTPGDQTVCNANGTIKSTEAATINGLIDYAKTKTMTVTVVILNELSDAWMTTEAARLACVTSTVNAFKLQPLVMFDVVQEHDYSFDGGIHPLTPDGVKVYNNQARAACPTCIIFSSFGSPMSHPGDSTADIEPHIIRKKVENGENVVAIHDYRSSNWWSITGARVMAYRKYLDSIGKHHVPVIFDEPNRHGFTWPSTEQEFNTAGVAAKAAGAAMWVFHHGASFDMSTSSLFSQLNETEIAITLSMAKALSDSRRAPVSMPSQ